MPTDTRWISQILADLRAFTQSNSFVSLERKIIEAEDALATDVNRLSLPRMTVYSKRE